MPDATISLDDRLAAPKPAAVPWVTHVVAAVTVFPALVIYTISEHDVVDRKTGMGGDQAWVYSPAGLALLWLVSSGFLMVEVGTLRLGHRWVPRLMAWIGTSVIAVVSIVPAAFQLQPRVSRSELTAAALTYLVLFTAYAATLVAMRLTLLRRRDR